MLCSHVIWLQIMNFRSMICHGAQTDEINIIYPHMEYEVVVCEQGTGNWKSLGMKMCIKEEIMK